MTHEKFSKELFEMAGIWLPKEKSSLQDPLFKDSGSYRMRPVARHGLSWESMVVL